MAGRKAFSLVELLVVVSLVSLLAGIIAPGVSAAKRHAQVAACASQFRGIGTALATYTADSLMYMPPFAFSQRAEFTGAATAGPFGGIAVDYNTTIAESGHWGGNGRPATKTNTKPKLNLYCLVDEQRVPAEALVCPAVPAEFREGEAALPEAGRRISSYCMRFPPSGDLFSTARWMERHPLAKSPPLNAYRLYSGGREVVSPGSPAYRAQVPIVRLGRQYRLNYVGGGVFDPAGSVIAADAFWWQQPTQPQASQPLPQRAGWRHQSRFNVLRACGSVKTVTDDGTVAANTVGEGGAPGDDGVSGATYAENVWQYFENK